MNDVILPTIPEYITVHLGRPDSPARNVTVPFADYIKNVASSEVYPTWPESAIRANVLAQISFALNRIYTEYYRSRGYNFDITNSTSIDQSFVYGRDIFENISEIVDDIFNDYIARQNTVNPLFAVYCDGIEVQCNGLSQWGSVELAERGLTPYDILQNYYGTNINIIRDAPILGVSESYPGTPLRLGDVGDNVRLIQLRLNCISKNYPNIPKIPSPDGLFAVATEDAVRAFQEQFGLTSDGIVGRATWYAIARIYAGVKRLTDVASEGIPVADATLIYNGRLEEGDSGVAVRELQYLLAFISAFNQSVRPVAIDGLFGSTTRGAVEDFQYDYGLTVDGIVGEMTWNAIYSTYRNLLESLPENYFAASTRAYPGTPLRRGSTGEDVAVLQDYLNQVADVYPDIPRLTVDGVFGSDTERAVLEFQRIFSLPQSGVVGAATWNQVADIYRTIAEGAYGSGTQFGGSLS